MDLEQAPQIGRPGRQAPDQIIAILTMTGTAGVQGALLPHQGRLAGPFHPQAIEEFLHRAAGGDRVHRALFGGAKVNAVNVAVNWRLAPSEMEHTINDADATVLFVGCDFRAQLDYLLGDGTMSEKVGFASCAILVTYSSWHGRQRQSGSAVALRPHLRLPAGAHREQPWQVQRAAASGIANLAWHHITGLSDCAPETNDQSPVYRYARGRATRVWISSA